MSYIDEQALYFMHARLEKLAATPTGGIVGGAGKILGSLGSHADQVLGGLRNNQAIGSAGALGGLGMAAGGLVGGATKAHGAYQESKEHGEGTGAAVLHGLGAGFSGVGSGARAGAVLGAGAGYLGHNLNPAAAEGLRKSISELGAHNPNSMIPINNPIGMVARFGQRAAHSLTGWTPQGGLEELRHGSYAAKQSLGALKNKSEAAGKDLTGKFVAPTAREMELAEKRVAATQASQDMGLTNLPGYARALSKDPKATLLTAAGDAWHGMDPMSKSLMIGLPAVQGAMELKNSKEEDPLHRSRLERAAGMGANVAGGLLMSPLTQTMQMGLGPYAGRLGAATGRAADRVSEGASSMIGRARASLAQHASTQAAPAAVPGLAVPQQGAVLDGQPIPR